MRAWALALPRTEEHLIRDYGASFLALSVLALAAAWIGERRLVVVALVVLSLPGWAAASRTAL